MGHVGVWKRSSDYLISKYVTRVDDVPILNSNIHQKSKDRTKSEDSQCKTVHTNGVIKRQLNPLHSNIFLKMKNQNNKATVFYKRQEQGNGGGA